MSEGDGSYRGALGAFPFAFRRSESLLFRAYVVVGGLTAVVLALAFLVSLALAAADTATAGGGTFTFSRAFLLVVGFLTVFPLLAPVLFVARRHRRVGSDPRYDAALAAAGGLFLLSLYLGVVASMPACFVLDGEQVCRDPPTGAFAPVVRALYAVPPALSWLIPAAAAALVYVVHRVVGGREAAFITRRDA